MADFDLLVITAWKAKAFTYKLTYSHRISKDVLMLNESSMVLQVEYRPWLHAENLPSIGDSRQQILLTQFCLLRSRVFREHYSGFVLVRGSLVTPKRNHQELRQAVLSSLASLLL